MGLGFSLAKSGSDGQNYGAGYLFHSLESFASWRLERSGREIQLRGNCFLRTPTEFLFSTTDFNSYVTLSIADGAPQRVNGPMAASKSPGLGIQPKLDVLGKRVVVVE